MKISLKYKIVVSVLFPRSKRALNEGSIRKFQEFDYFVIQRHIFSILYFLYYGLYRCCSKVIISYQFPNFQCYICQHKFLVTWFINYCVFFFFFFFLIYLLLSTFGSVNCPWTSNPIPWYRSKLVVTTVAKCIQLPYIHTRAYYWNRAR